MEKWYAVQVKTGKEQETACLCKLLIEKEILAESFIPIYERMKRYQGAWHKEKIIMFPGYIFLVTSQVDKLFQKLKSVPELTKILGDGTEFIPIQEAEKEVMLQLSNDKHIAEMSCGYLIGKQVIILSGPLMNMEGKIKKIDRHKRIAILEIRMFGRYVDIKMGLEIVKRL